MQIGSALTIGVLALGLLAAFWQYTQDDVFITYAYSRNLALGHGFVFNLGEQVQGTTTPLYTLLMAAVYRLTPDLLHAGNFLSALFLLIGIALAVTISRRSPSLLAQVALPLLLVTSPLIYVSFGMETLFYLALLMATFWLWARQQRVAAMLTAAALTWTRADGLVLGVTLCMIALWEARAVRPIWRAVPWRLGVIYLAAIAPWFVFAALYFGSPLPNTFSAKQELLHGLKFWTDGWAWWQSFYGNNSLTLLGMPLVGIGLWQTLRQASLRAVGLWALLYLLGYTALNVTAFWYYTAWVVVLILLAVIGAEWGLRWLLCQSRWITRRRLVTMLAALALISTAGLGIARAWTFHNPPERVGTYQLVGEWLQAHSEPQATVVVADLGIVGYYAQRRMIDSFGLIVPALATSHDLSSAVQKFQPDYVVTTQYFFFEALTGAAWFRALYQPIAQFSTTHDDFSPMTLYKRARATPDQAISRPISARWPGLAELQMATLPDGDQVWSGGTLTLQLNWQALADSPPDDHLFVHVLDSAGVLVAQVDGPPDDQPITGWHSGDQITDVRPVALPATLSAGDYTLEIGWYDWHSGKRVTLADPSVPASDSFRLPFIIHNAWPGGSGKP